LGHAIFQVQHQPLLDALLVLLDLEKFLSLGQAISSFSSIGWIFSRGSDTIPFPQPKPRTVRVHMIMPSVCSKKVAQLEWSGVRKGENVLQPFNLCDRLLGVHSASIFTRSVSPKESGFGQKLKPVPTGVGDVYTRYQSDPHALVIGPKLTRVAM
jgi:hypothetical protein